MRKLFSCLLWLTRFRSAYMLAIAFAIVVAGGISTFIKAKLEDDFSQHFFNQAWLSASGLETETMNGVAMGTAALLGLNEVTFKEVIEGSRRSNDPEANARLHSARLLVDAVGIKVVNNQGVVVMHDTAGKSALGANVSRWAYWQQAVRGNKNAYPGVDLQTGKRMLYISAPIRHGTTPTGSLIGVVVVELDASDLDRKIGFSRYPAMLISPEGIVFSASQPIWLYKSTQRLSSEEIIRLRTEGRYGQSFGREQATILPFDPSESMVGFDGKVFSVAAAPIRWNDPAGDWRLIMLADLSSEVPKHLIWGIALATAAVILILLELLKRAVHYEAARRSAVEEVTRAAKVLEANAQQKARLSELTISLQQAKTLSELADLFFAKVALLVPVHLGALYAMDQHNLGLLQLCGGFGILSSPRSISVGEGVVGQCALDKKGIVVKDVPPSYWTISSALGEQRPKTIICLPVENNGVFYGVIEFASLNDNTKDHKELLESLIPVLALNMAIVQSDQIESRGIENMPQSVA